MFWCFLRPLKTQCCIPDNHIYLVTEVKLQTESSETVQTVPEEFVWRENSSNSMNSHYHDAWLLPIPRYSREKELVD